MDWPPQFLQLSPFRWERTGAGRKGRLSMLRSSSSLLLRACLGHLDSGTRFGQGCCSCGPALCQVPCPGDEAGVGSGSVSAPGLDCTAHPVLDLGLSLGDVEGGPRGRARLPSLVPQRSWVSWCSSASGVSVQAPGQSSRGLCGFVSISLATERAFFIRGFSSKSPEVRFYLCRSEARSLPAG